MFLFLIGGMSNLGLHWHRIHPHPNSNDIYEFPDYSEHQTSIHHCLHSLRKICSFAVCFHCSPKTFRTFLCFLAQFDTKTIRPKKPIALREDKMLGSELVVKLYPIQKWEYQYAHSTRSS